MYVLCLILVSKSVVMIIAFGCSFYGVYVRVYALFFFLSPSSLILANLVIERAECSFWRKGDWKSKLSSSALICLILFIIYHFSYHAFRD